MQSRGITYAIAGLTMLIMISGSASADRWAAPKKEHWSPSRTYVLSVNNKEKTLSLKQSTGNQLVQSWRIKYPQHAAPVAAHITKNGEYVVLQDVWHNVGYGKSLVILDSSGKVVRSYEIKDFLSQKEIDGAFRTASSRWWSSDSQFFFSADQRKFHIITKEGTVLSFDLKTGAREKLTESEKQRIRKAAPPKKEKG